MIETLETLLYCLILMTAWLGISLVAGIVIGYAMSINEDRND